MGGEVVDGKGFAFLRGMQLNWNGEEYIISHRPLNK